MDQRPGAGGNPPAPPPSHSEFPALALPGIYLDSAAKTLTCRAALEAMASYYQTSDANVERGVYDRAAWASQAIEEAREAVASMIHVPPSHLILTHSTTDSLNMVALGIRWRPGDRVVTTVLEHHSNFLPWLALRSKGVEVRVAGADRAGFIDEEEFARLAQGSRLVAFTHATNTLGTLQDVARLSAVAKEAGCLVVVDGAQAASHEPVDVGALRVDVYAFSGHKCFGPTGTGALYLSDLIQAQMEPPVLGGGSASDSSPEGFVAKRFPPTAVWEPGTRNIAGVIGFGAAARSRAALDWAGEALRLRGLVATLLDGLGSIPGVEVFGTTDVTRKIPVVSFAVPGLSPHQAGMLLWKRFGIMVRTGHHCAPSLWRTLYGRPEGSVRVSMHVYTTLGDITRLLEAVDQLARYA